MAQQIAQLAMDLLQALNAHDPDRVASFYADDYEGIDVAYAGVQHGPRERVQVYTRFVTAFPDLYFTGETVTQRNRAVLIWTMRGTHRDKIMNIPATGRIIEVRGVSILTYEAGKIKRGLTIWDTGGFLRALKLLPDLR